MKTGEGHTIRLQQSTFDALDKLRRPHESWNVFLHRFLGLKFNPKTDPQLARRHNEEIENGKK